MKIGETYTVVIGETEEELTLDSDAVTIGSTGMGSSAFMRLYIASLTFSISCP